MTIIGIVAVDQNGAIGKGGRLPWRYPADMKFFRQQTTGHACVMGRNTWASLPAPLKNRLNIILTRSANVETNGSIMVLRHKAEVLSLKDYLSCDLFIIGGGQTYRDFLEDIDRWIVTEVPLKVEGADTFMPEDFLTGFVASKSLRLDEGLEVTFYIRDGEEVNVWS
jgi:dihydrofolate reductase